MSELIDLWRAIELLSDKRSDCNFFVDGQTAYEALSDMIKAVKELPRIDLVRCGECEYYEESEYIEGDMACKYHIGHTYYTEADRFCYYGERNSKNNSNQI